MGSRTASYRLLLTASRWLTVVVTALFLLFLSAGTFLLVDPERPGAMTLAMKKLAVVLYDGIVPFNGNQTNRQGGDGGFLFTIHRFANAFSWTCDRCPPALQSESGMAQHAGVARLGSDLTADPLPLMLGIADAVAGHGPRSFSECYSERVAPGFERSPPGCPESAFFDTWRHFYPPISDGYVPAAVYLTTLLVAVMQMLNEVLIVRAPRLMRCRCIFLKGWCPHPKGTAVEIEALPPHSWDRIRAITYTYLPAWFGLVILYHSLYAPLLLSYLRAIDAQLPGGLSMRPRQHSIYLWFVWGCFTISALASVLAFVRYRIGRPRAYDTLQDLSYTKPRDEKPAKQV